MSHEDCLKNIGPNSLLKVKFGIKINKLAASKLFICKVAIAPKINHQFYSKFLLFSLDQEFGYYPWEFSDPNRIFIENYPERMPNNKWCLLDGGRIKVEAIVNGPSAIKLWNSEVERFKIV